MLLLHPAFDYSTQCFTVAQGAWLQPLGMRIKHPVLDYDTWYFLL
jgi:hypothetical protein